MNRVIVESPFAGDTKLHIEYAQKCLLDSINKGESPFAGHLLYTQVLNDADFDERERGIACASSWYGAADKCVVYTNLGISEGMKRGIELATRLGKAVEFRTIPWR